MMHIVGSTPKSPNRSNSKTTLEDRLVDRLVDSQDLNETANDAANDTSIVTIEVPAQSPIADSPASTPTASTPTAVRPTFASKNNLAALNIISITSEAPTKNATTPDQPSDPASVTDLIHAINLVPARPSQAAPTQITPYSVHNTHRYLQPYPLNATPATPVIRRRPTPKLPWLECSGGLAAFTIISGVIAIDGLKQSPSVPRPTTTQQTRPTIARLPANPNALPQVSISELMNSGRTLPVPAGAMNFPGQVAMNPTQNPIQSPMQSPKRDLNLGTAEMNSIVIPRTLEAAPVRTPQPIAQPSVAPRRKEIAPPETTPQPPVRTIPQPIEQPVLTPQATQTSEMPPSQAMPPSQDPQFLEPSRAPIQNAPTSIAPLQNDPKVSPTTLKQIRWQSLPERESSTMTEPSPNGLSSVILEANPQSAVSATPNDSLRLEVSKL